MNKKSKYIKDLKAALELADREIREWQDFKANALKELNKIKS